MRLQVTYGETDISSARWHQLIDKERKGTRSKREVILLGIGDNS